MIIWVPTMEQPLLFLAHTSVSLIIFSKFSLLIGHCLYLPNLIKNYNFVFKYEYPVLPCLDQRKVKWRHRSGIERTLPDGLGTTPLPVPMRYSGIYQSPWCSKLWRAVGDAECSRAALQMKGKSLQHSIQITMSCCRLPVCLSNNLHK